MWYYRHSGEMYHHGIKGMKWGVRRFENKDGTLTPAGKKRYADDKVGDKKQLKISDKKSQHRQNLEAKYQEKKGMSQQEAEQAAAKRIRAEKFVAAAAVTTVAACVAYSKYKNFAVDKVLSEDTDFQRIMNMRAKDAIEDRDRMYVAYNKRDKVKYKGLLGGTFKQENDYMKFMDPDDPDLKSVVDVGVKAKQKIKVASRKRVQDTFENLYKNDGDFKKDFENTVARLRFSPNVAGHPKLAKVADKISQGGQLTDKEIKTAAYDIFNIGIADTDKSSQNNSKKLFEALKKQGVNAIKDMNDSKYSGYGSKDPLIIFDGAFDYAKRTMSDDEVNSNAKKAKQMLVTEALAKSGAKLGAYGGAIYGANAAANKAAVNSYKKKHPNTQLSDKEILEMLKKEKK